jgi:porin
VLLPLLTAPAVLRAQDLRAAPPDTGPPPAQPTQRAPPPPQPAAPTTGDQAAPAATQPAAPAGGSAQTAQGQQAGSPSLARSPVSGRPFGMDLLVLPTDHLLGDWFGLRTRLEDGGITPRLTFESNLAGNPVGGIRRGFTEADNLGLNVTFDLDKICGLKGGSFYVSMSQRSGANLSAIDVGNTFTIQQVYGRETFQVINVDYFQKLLDDKVEVRVGRIAAGDVFDVSPYDYLFMQNAIDGNPVGIFFNAPGMTAYPNATWGAELKVQTTERTYVHAGVYNGDVERTHQLNRHGLDWSMRGPVFLIGEAVYQVNQKKDDPQYPGNYKFGMWFDGHSYQDFGTQVLGAKAASLGFVPRVRDDNFGFYGLFDQIVFKFSSPDERILRGIGVTGCVQAAPLQDRSQMPLFFEAGILARGIFRSRPRDVAGFGVIYGHFSSDLRNAERLAQRLDPTVGVKQEETVFEWNYTFRFKNGAFFFEPDLQYIIRPGGTGNIPNAFVIGAQTGINF